MNFKAMFIRVFFLVLAVSAFAQSQHDHGHEHEGVGDHDHHGDHDHTDGPYMDENGRLCQDKVEMMEDIEYEDQIHCKVEMQKSCQFINSPATSDEKACHTMYHRECETVYRPQTTKVKVQVCPEDEDENSQQENDLDNLNSIVMDVRPNPPGVFHSSDCIHGRRKVCITKYETECTTEMINHEMTEDYPKCHVEMVPKCVESNCRDVPAMRCRIEQRQVVKSKPETKCHRSPREFCHKEDCQVDEKNSTSESLKPNCYFREQIVNEVVPEEKCKLRPERVCHPLESETRAGRNFKDGSTGEARKKICEMVPRESCEKKRVNPKRVLKPMKKKICRFPRPNSSYDRRIMKKMNFDFPHEP